MTTAFYQSSWGDLRLWISEISTIGGRDKVVHDLSTGDVHPIQDRGGQNKVARVTILFDWMDGDSIAPLDRLRLFLAQIDDKARPFRHPILGTYLARIGDFNHKVDGQGVISGEAEILPAAAIAPFAAPGSNGIPAAGAGAVDDAADAADIEFNEVDASSPLPAAAKQAVSDWTSAADPNPRAVLAQTGSLTAQLGELADTFSESLDTWQAYKATILLSDAVRSAAETTTSQASSTFVAKIAARIALRAYLAGIYGADEVDLRYTQAMALNDIANPASLDPGVELVLPQKPPVPRVA